METQENRNQRYLLRAFEAPDACRAALIIKHLSQGHENPVSRRRINDIWKSSWPDHVHMTGRQCIGNRIRRGLSLLRVAGALNGLPNGDVTVKDRVLLAMSSANLFIVVDSETGHAIPPGEWTQRPTVPDYLVDIQQELHDGHENTISLHVPKDSMVIDRLNKVVTRIQEKGYDTAAVLVEALDMWLAGEAATDEFEATEEGSAPCGRRLVLEQPDVFDRLQEVGQVFIDAIREAESDDAPSQR